MSDDADLPGAEDIDALDFTGPVIDTTEGIVTLDGVLLALSATVMHMADQVWIDSAGPVMDSGSEDAPGVVELLRDHVELGACLNDCAARRANYGTTLRERNMIRRACHLILSAVRTEPSGIPEQVLTAVGMSMENEDSMHCPRTL